MTPSNLGSAAGKQLKHKPMRDKVTIDRVALLHPKVRQEVQDCIVKAEAGFPVNMAIRVVQGLRTIDEQNALYAQGRNGDTRPKVTNAKGGHSYHNYGLAIDFALLHDKDGNGSFEELSWDTARDGDDDGLKDWMEVVKVFEAVGWIWGGRFATIVDAPHLQKTFGKKIAELLAMYNQGKFIAGTKYLDV